MLQKVHGTDLGSFNYWNKCIDLTFRKQGASLFIQILLSSVTSAV